MIIRMTPGAVADLCDGRFTLEGMEAIEQYLDNCGIDEPLYIGDICISFSEIELDEEEFEEYDREGRIIACLTNGNYIVAN